jgi:hypothetical protein
MELKHDVILNGIHIGEHGFVPEKIKQEIYERAVKPGYNFVTIRTRRVEEVPQHYFIEWAQYLTDNKIYFLFSNQRSKVSTHMGGVEKVKKYKEKLIKKFNFIQDSPNYRLYYCL